MKDQHRTAHHVNNVCVERGTQHTFLSTTDIAGFGSLSTLCPLRTGTVVVAAAEMAVVIACARIGRHIGPGRRMRRI